MWRTECFWVLPPTPHSYVETLICCVKMLGGRIFGRWQGHEGGALMVGLAPFQMVGGSEIASSLLSPPLEGTRRRWLSPDSGSIGTLILDFPELWEIHICFWSHTAYGRCGSSSNGLRPSYVLWEQPGKSPSPPLWLLGDSLHGLMELTLQDSQFVFRASLPQGKCSSVSLYVPQLTFSGHFPMWGHLKK